MRLLSVFSLLNFLAGPAVATYNDSCPECTEIYDGDCEQNNGPVQLVIGNGGAGQSHLVKALANNFIKNQTQSCDDANFKIGWLKGDTTETIENIKNRMIDVGITYHKQAEQNAIDARFANGCKYEGNSITPCFHNCNKNATEKPCSTFTDHFYLVGPEKNPAKIEKNDTVLKAFTKIYEAGEGGEARFLTRFDKSATNIKDSEMWINIGQVPWANVYSKWYHQYIDYPVQALTEAITKEEYTITDRGTYITLMSQFKCLTDHIDIYQTGENADQLLNPADIITLPNPPEPRKAYVEKFVEWVHGPEGQRVIRNYSIGEKKYCLYKGFDRNSSIKPENCEWEFEGQNASDDDEREEL